MNSKHFFLLLLSCAQLRTEEVDIIIFVHGIMSVTPYLTPKNVHLFFKDQILNTAYAKGVELTRRTQYFWWGQAMQQFGLQEIDIQSLAKTKGASAIAYLYEQVDQYCHQANKKKRYYTFGWSGLLSHRQRFYDAHEFFIGLEQLRHELSKENLKPHITVIGYSHGGNVALDLAAVYERFYPQSDMRINTLILLGVPLITETDHFINSNLFEKIYNISSPLDRIQSLDFFSFNRFFSKKLFKNRKNFKIPSKLTQIIVQIHKPVKTKHGKMIEEKRKHLRKNLSNPAVVSGRSHLFSNASPGHIELWFFGWTPQHYSKGFPLKPLPLIVFVPYILHIIEQNKHQFDLSQPVIADIRPKDTWTLLKQQQMQQKVIIPEPFIESTFFENMKTLAQNIKPHNYTNYDFKRHLREAKQKAIELHTQTELLTRKFNKEKAYKSRMRKAHT